VNSADPRIALGAGGRGFESHHPDQICRSRALSSTACYGSQDPLTVIDRRVEGQPAAGAVTDWTLGTRQADVAVTAVERSLDLVQARSLARDEQGESVLAAVPGLAVSYLRGTCSI
jgi:hypothetical protein